MIKVRMAIGRFGFKGQTQITDRVTGYGQWQSQFNTSQPESDSESMFTRLGFAGIKVSDYGSFDYGRNTGVLYRQLITFTEFAAK